MAQRSHKLATYPNDGVRITYCMVCGCEVPHMTSDCSGQYIEEKSRLAEIAAGNLDYRDGEWHRA